MLAFSVTVLQMRLLPLLLIVFAMVVVAAILQLLAVQIAACARCEGVTLWAWECHCDPSSG
jgi:hypothetical protein